MSIPLVIETQNEVRRLLIAGSSLAAGDYRLKKLLPQMQKAGEGVPVFKRIAEALEKVIVSENEALPEKLLELANLVNAVLYTQGKTGIDGPLEDIETAGMTFMTTIPYRRLKPIIEALTSKGAGRLEIISSAYRDGIFKDLRLLRPLVYALDTNNFPEINEMLVNITESLGVAAVPILKEGFDFKGGKAYARRLELISKLSGKNEAPFITRAVEEGSDEVRVAAVKALKDFPEYEASLLELSKERKKDIREASLTALAHIDSEAAVKKVYEAFYGKDRELVLKPLRDSRTAGVVNMLLEEGEKYLASFIRTEKGLNLFAKKEEPVPDDTVNAFAAVLFCLEGKKDKAVFDFLSSCLDRTKSLQQYKTMSLKSYVGESTLARLAARAMIRIETREAFEALDQVQVKFGSAVLAYSFEAALRSMEPEYVYNRYSGYGKNGRRSDEGKQIFTVMDRYVQSEELKWDPRWLRVLMEKKEVKLFCSLHNKGNTSSLCVKFLLKELETANDFNSTHFEPIINSLIDVSYPDITAVILQALEFNFKKASAYSNYYLDHYGETFRRLPAEAAGPLEEFAARYNNDAAQKLMAIAQDLKNKG